MGKSAKVRKGRAYMHKREYVPQTSPCPTPHKRAHGTRADAKKAKRQMNRRPGVVLSIYVCECGCYHIGSHAHVEHRSQARAIAKRKLAA